jgi:hypothetical protein
VVTDYVMSNKMWQDIMNDEVIMTLFLTLNTVQISFTMSDVNAIYSR